ncbi:hypothetical protein ACIQCJ_19115 [Streptomyces sp. NPDC093221]|uniref:hypothetical protein n=1 Tax=unclassified Streptomyces TaxID=2593676 RepID=UPI0033A40CBC
MVASALRQQFEPTLRKDRRPRRLARRAILGSSLTAVFTAVMLTVTQSAAYAGGPYLWANDGNIGQRMTVCAQTLDVRSSYGGTPFNHLTYGQTFTVHQNYAEFGSEYVRGFAWGNVNAEGFVQNGWFCF